MGLAIVLVAAPLRAEQLAEIRAAGLRRSVLLALNPLISDLPRALVVLILLAQLPSWFLEAGRLAGGVLLIAVVWRTVGHAYGAGRKHDTVVMMNRPPDVPRSLAIWLLDPVPYLLWATVIGPLLLASWRRAPWWGAFVLAGLYGALLLGAGAFNALAVAFRKRGLVAARVASGLVMVAVVVLALLQIWRGGEALAGRFF